MIRLSINAVWMLLIMLCLFGIAWGLSQYTLPVRAQVISARAGYVSRVEGDVQFRRHGDSKLMRLSSGVTLSKGDVVLTGKDGRAELTLNPGSFLQVAPLSQVWIYEVNPDRVHFDILRGEVFVTIESLGSGLSLVLDTPPAELAVIKDGRYIVRVAADDSTEASVTAGQLRFVDFKGKTIVLKKHRRVRFGAPARRKVWDMDTITERQTIAAPSPLASH